MAYIVLGLVAELAGIAKSYDSVLLDYSLSGSLSESMWASGLTVAFFEGTKFTTFVDLSAVKNLVRDVGLLCPGALMARETSA